MSGQFPALKVLTGDVLLTDVDLCIAGPEGEKG